MQNFTYSFTVDAPKRIVRQFHHDPSVLKRLTPPPLFIQLRYFEPLGEGSKAEFTIWMGPFPARWQVVHSEVSDDGFTDAMISGPLKSWKHQHRFVAIDREKTEVRESIEYEYKDGLRGIINRLMYSKLSLSFLFTARKLITRKQVSRTLSSQEGQI